MIRPPLCYHFTIAQSEDRTRIQGDFPGPLSMTFRGHPSRVLGDLMRHSMGMARGRRMIPKRAAFVIEGQNVRCYVFTV